MNQDSLIILITIFVGLVALSQVAQVVAILSLARRLKDLQAQVTVFAPRAEALMLSAKETLDQSRKQFAEISGKVNEITIKVNEVMGKAALAAGKANDILDATRTQIVRVEDLLVDVTTRAKVQMDRAELVLDDTFGRVQETVVTVHNGVMRPLKEINGITVGIRAAIGHMLKGGRPSVAQATQDEEMFI